MALPEIKAFFDEATSTITYLVWDGGTGRGIVIDPVLDFDPAGGEVDTSTADVVLAEVAARGIVVEWVLETHVHADHLSAAPLIRSRTGARVAIGEHIRSVQTIFRPIFNADDVRADGGDFDLLLTDGQTLKVGDLEIEVMHTPGHTPADVSYRIGGRGLRRRYPVHAGLRNRTRRFPRWRCAPALPVGPQAPGATG